MGIERLGVTTVPALIGERHGPLSFDIARIRIYRNKLVQGQISGNKIPSRQLERDVLMIVEWVALLANAAESALGYDGLKRNTYRKAKSAANIVVANYPFAAPAELRAWLDQIANQANH